MTTQQDFLNAGAMWIAPGGSLRASLLRSLISTRHDRYLKGITLVRSFYQRGSTRIGIGPVMSLGGTGSMVWHLCWSTILD